MTIPFFVCLPVATDGAIISAVENITGEKAKRIARDFCFYREADLSTFGATLSDEMDSACADIASDLRERGYTFDFEALCTLRDGRGNPTHL